MKIEMKMSRRAWLATTLSTVAAWPIAGRGVDAKPIEGSNAERGSFALDTNRVRFFSPSVQSKLTLLVAGDTHLFLDDARGAPFTQYSGRMAKAYNQTRHFKTGAVTNPQACFEQTLAEAKKRSADLLVLVGDIFSFPSEAAIEWAHRKLQESGVLFLYVAGNHDWHYEGMAGTGAALRAEWTAKRLLPLYQGRNPLMASVEVKGIRFVVIDNSTNEILPEQLDFWRAQVAGGTPMVLLMHIPLYAPGRGINFGCGHPQWGAQSDKNWEIERRLKWPESGHTVTTLAFCHEVFAAPNLLGVFAGHTHKQSLDCVNGVPQFVTEANATGGYLDVEFQSTEEKR
ncbi:MAG: metallophosphoesterase [Kiritimatiellae bacterium]|nr:metallophosphoesterase [Kiritimatiellia bacterium]